MNIFFFFDDERIKEKKKKTYSQNSIQQLCKYYG